MFDFGFETPSTKSLTMFHIQVPSLVTWATRSPQPKTLLKLNNLKQLQDFDHQSNRRELGGFIGLVEWVRDKDPSECGITRLIN